LFGWFNQALGVFTALGLLLASASGIVMWWRRKSPGKLGAPSASPGSCKIAYGVIAAIAVLGVLLPLVGLSLLIVLAVERWCPMRIPVARACLGLLARN
jgi:uncharacterized iron-regulated membrane protein